MPLIDKLLSLVVEQPVQDQDSPRVKVLDASSSASKRDPLKVIAKKIGLSFGGDSRDFAPPEVDLEQIESAYEAEAYVRQGIDKYIDKMFKAGWTFSGKNPNTVDYIKQRFAMIAEVTQMPTEKLFMEYSEDVVKFSNAIIAKARMTDQSQLPQGATITGLNNMEPVVGYFLLNATTMSVKRDKFGAVKQWQQEVEGQDRAVKFKAEDIIHTYYKRKKGNAFGVPFLNPVLDDIRALRQAEDNVLKMLYRNINPFYHIAIGSNELPGDDDEIMAAKEEVEGMEVDGGLVTSERWKITAIAADKIIDSNPYLKYFEERVFSGLGVPATMFGRGATANKSTSDNMDSEFIDRVKAFQRVGEADVNEFMIKELLMEGGFDPVLNPDDMVFFKFNEIDLDMQIKLENHAIYKYEHCSITEDEMRQLLGLDPITDRSNMYTALVDMEKAAASASAKQEETGTAETNNKVKPTNKKKNKEKESVDVDKVIRLYLEHADELNESILKSLDEFYNGDKYALTRIKSDIYFKEKMFKDITDNSILNSDMNDYITLTNKRIFKQLLNEIADAISTIKSSSGSVNEYVGEIVNSIFKTIKNSIETTIKTQIQNYEEAK